MKKTLFKATALIALALNLGLSQVNAQNQAWILAPQYYKTGANFEEAPLPTTNDYDGSPAVYSQNIQTDADGNILFFIVDNKIYDRSGNEIHSTAPYLIEQLDSYQRLTNVNYFNEHVVMNGTTSEVIVLPDKNDCNLFHIFSTGHIASPLDVYTAYGKLRVSYQANGQITPSSGFMTYVHTDASGTYAASMQSIEQIIGISDFGVINMTHQRCPAFAVVDNGDSYTVFYRNMDRLFRLTIDGTGISYNNYTTIPGDQMNERYEMEAVRLANGNYRIATFVRNYPNSGIWGVYVCDITPSGTVVSGSEKSLGYTHSLFSNINTRNFTGLEFNSTGSRVFVSHLPYNGTGGATLDYWDVSGTPVKTQISTDAQIGQGQIEMAKDGNLYVPRSNRLARVSNLNATPSVNINAVTISSYPLSNGFSQTPMRILQDQIDGSTVYDDVEPSTFHAITYNVTSNGTWNGGSNPIASGQSVIHIEKELRVKAGVSLTVKNMIIRFAPGARLVVENGSGSGQGGKLLIENTTLTNYEVCGKESMWLGVEVWGNSTAAQGTIGNSTQGVFRTQSTSKIEHALVGVLVSRRNEINGVPQLNSYNNNRNGGIVVTQSTEFFNCQTGIRFQNYNVGSNNVSNVSSSTFRWNGNLNTPSLKPWYHIYLVSCTDITVRASGFYQETPEIHSNTAHLGYGIYATNSGFKVFSSCSVLPPFGQDCPENNVVPSKFENLYMGVRVINSNSKPFTVLRNEFTDCRYGVYSVYAKNQIISRNKINVYEHNGQSATGIYVSRGDGYTIEENYLKEHNNPSVTDGTGLSYGIIIDISGENHNEVYKNTFEKLRVGTQAQGVNGTLIAEPNDNSEGLQYMCNNFVSPIYLTDIGVNGRIDIEQGLLGGTSLDNARKRAARNTFSMYGENQSTYPDHDIMLYPGTQHIDYVHLADNSHTPDNYTVSGSTQVIPTVQMYGGLPVSANAGTCPSNFGLGVIIVMSAGATSTEDRIDSLNNLIDGGDAAHLLNAIASNPNNIGTVELLLSASPYLSDEVLEGYLNSGASDENIKQIFAVNSGLSVYLQNALNNSGRSKSLKNDLEIYRNNHSARKKLINDIKAAEQDLFRIQRLTIASILTDTTITETADSLIRYLENCRGIGFKESLLSYYANHQLYDKFEALIDELSGELPEEQIEIYKIQYALYSENSMQSAIENDPSLVSQLELIAEQGNDESAAAKASLLLAVLNEKEIEIPVLPLQASSKSMMIQQSEENSVEAFSTIKIYPNPSEGIVYLNFSELETKSVVVQLIDLTGKEVFKNHFSNTSGEKLNLSHIRKGAYLVNVQMDGVKTKAELLILE